MSFAHYLLQVNLYLIVFYAFYRLLLAKETYFMLNRFYLIAAGILSICIPFIRLEWLTTQKAAQKVYASVNWDVVLAKTTIVSQPTNSLFNWIKLLALLYLLGVLFFMCKLVYNLFVVNNLIKHAQQGAAFSFFRKKVLDQNLPEKATINAHEEAHIKQWHTADVIFFELLGILTWVNPIIYFYKSSIKNIHEFLADEAAANYQGDKAAYAMLILSQTFGLQPNHLANGFFKQSLVKKRIKMLHKERSKKITVMKYGIFIPLFAILIIFSSATVRKNKDLLSISEQIPLNKPIEMVKNIVDENLSGAENTTAFVVRKNQLEDLHYFIIKKTIYPDEAIRVNTNGKIKIKFTIFNGALASINNLNKLGYGCEAVLIKTIKSYPGFSQIDDGTYSIDVLVNLSKSPMAGLNDKTTLNKPQTVEENKESTAAALNKVTSSPATKNNDDKAYSFVSVEKIPEFPGGQAKFNQYISKVIRYPSAAQAQNIQGKVFASFVVDKDGSLNDIKIVRTPKGGDLLGEEALRILKTCPKWNPGIQNGRPVSVRFTIAINFSLQFDDDNTDKIHQLPTHVNNLLLVLDGKEQPLGSDINAIKPNDIESINILKDATALANYGEKAKNGVIFIKTKAASASNTKNQEFKLDKLFSTLKNK